jgi:acetyltransferase-like isoleucine patch superfamily enzyme
VTGARVHPSAIVEDGVVLGEGTAVWDNAHIRAGAVIGRDCIVGGKTYVAPGVVIGDRVKLNAFVYVCTGVTLRDGVMVGAHAVFTNDRYPRATTADLSALRPSEADDATLPTLVGEGASIGAGAVIGCGIEIGPWAMVGMGAVVTRSVEAHQIVVGNPARARGRACRCGHPVTPLDGVCGHCGRPFPAGSTTAPK